MVSKTDSDYRTLSSRIKRDPTFIKFNDLCRIEDKTHSIKIKELINQAIKNKDKPYFFAGNIRVVYNPVLNNYSVKAVTPAGDETNVWENLSEDLVKSLKQELDHAIETRNKWVHGLGEGRVAIPDKGVGGDENE